MQFSQDGRLCAVSVVRLWVFPFMPDIIAHSFLSNGDVEWGSEQRAKSSGNVEWET